MTSKISKNDLPAGFSSLKSEFEGLQKSFDGLAVALRDRETILDLIPILITFTDSKLRYVWVNKAYADWYRLPRADIIGKRIRDIIAPDSYRVARKHMVMALKGENVRFENVAFGADGKLRAVRASYIPVRQDHGTIPGFIAMVEDITPQKAAEHELDRRLEDLKAANEQIKALKGVIPICCSCKKIRNDRGYWEILEKYIRENSEADFTHGLCPDCAERLYPNLECVKRKK